MEKYINWKLVKIYGRLFIYYDLDPCIDKLNQALSTGKKYYFVDNDYNLDFSMYDYGRAISASTRSDIKGGKYGLISVECHYQKYPGIEKVAKKHIYLVDKIVAIQKTYKEGWLIYTNICEKEVDIDLIFYTIKIYGKLYF